MRFSIDTFFKFLSNFSLIIFLFLSLTISFALGENNNNGKYILLTCLILTLIFHLLSKRGILKIKINTIHIYLIVFIICCLLSGLHASNTSIVINKSIDILEILFMVSIAYLCFQDDDNVNHLLKVIMWAGYMVTYYSILFYGWKKINVILSVGYRIGNNALNANTLGMCAAYSVIITIYYMLYDRIKLWNLAAIPAIIIIAASGSRKALIIIIMGFILLFILKNFKDKNVLRGFFKTLIMIIIAALILYGILQIPMFSSILNRMQKMFNAFFGRGKADSSSLARIKLVEIGKQLFSRSPLIGVGIDNPKLYTYSVFKADNYYLHNNYIELLAGVGLIGTIAYYSIYAAILVILIKYKDFNDREFNVVFTIFVLKLIMDVGYVSYDIKLTYFYLLLFYIKAIKLKKNKVMKWR